MDNHPSPPSSFIDPKDVLSRVDEPATTNADTESTTSHTDSATKTSTSEQSKKKRKSWGQVLPVPTTNLPPRKRAKTTEEKAQRHYERVQRNRLAAHNSRMRKQDEMDRVVAENNSLKQDNQHQAEEIKRLQDELAYIRSFQPLTRDSSRPLTPPLETSSPKFSELADPSSPPSLTSASSHEASSPAELADANPLLSPESFKAQPSDMKQFNDSHSAVDVELAKYFGEQSWMNGQDLNLFTANDMMVQPVPQLNAPTDSVTFDDFLNLDGLDETPSLSTTSENKSYPWVIPSANFDAYGTNDYNLFSQNQIDLTNTCF